MRRAASRADCTAGSNRATRAPMMATTTSSSISVKPRRGDRREEAHIGDWSLRMKMDLLPGGWRFHSPAFRGPGTGPAEVRPPPGRLAESRGIRHASMRAPRLLYFRELRLGEIDRMITFGVT